MFIASDFLFLDWVSFIARYLDLYGANQIFNFAESKH